MSASNRGQLADFLRSRRARLTPADVGLPGDSEPGRGGRPVRREEVAELSGVGVTWYTWLEQGRKITASPQVVDALARALRLSADEHRHLRELAGLAVAPPASSDDPQARLQRLVDAAAPNVASVYDLHFDYLAWRNEPYRLIRHDPAGLPAGWRNLLWMMFTDADNRARMTTWDRAARVLLSQFRAAAGRHPGDPRFTELTAALTEASPQFRNWWAQYPVRYFRPAEDPDQAPASLRITLELFQLRLEDDPGLMMVTQVPADPASRDRVAALLAGGPGCARPA